MPIATLMNELLRSKYISWSGYDFNNSRPGQAGKKEVFSGGGPLLTFLFVREVYRLRVNSQWEAGKDLTVWVAPPPLLKQQFVNGCIYPLNSPSTRINNSEPSNSFSSSHSPLIWICLWKARPSPPFLVSLLSLSPRLGHMPSLFGTWGIFFGRPDRGNTFERDLIGTKVTCEEGPNNGFIRCSAICSDSYPLSLLPPSSTHWLKFSGVFTGTYQSKTLHFFFRKTAVCPLSCKPMVWQVSNLDFYCFRRVNTPHLIRLIFTRNTYTSTWEWKST